MSTATPSFSYTRGTCTVCDRSIRILRNGTTGPHTTGRREQWNGRSDRCPGWGKKPKDDA